MPALDLVWNLIARDGASPAFAKVGASAEGASAAVGAFLKTMGVVGAGVAVGAAIKSAADFQSKMALIQTQAGATSAEVAKMSPAILSLAGQVAQAPEALATSLYHVESTGLRGAKALEAVKIAAEGARVGHADLEETTNALTATIASGMLPATETYSQAMGQLNTIVGAGDMKMSDLNEALGTGLLVTTKQYGVTINDVGAALADFGDNNIRGADAATQLRMAVQSIAKPGKDAADALGKVGLTVDQLRSDEQTGGLNKALTDLHSHLVNSGIDASQWGAILTDAFTKKAGSGILTLIGTFDRFQQKYQEVSKGADTFGAAWEATTKTAAFQFAQLKDTVDALGIRIGTILLPPLNSLAHLLVGIVTPLGSVVQWFGELPGPVKDFAYALGALKLTDMVGLLGRLQGAVAGVKAAFAEEAAMQRWSAAVAGIGSGVSAAEVSVSRLATASGVAQRALGALKSAGSNFVNFLGGPWVLAVAGIVGSYELMVNASKKTEGATHDATEAQRGFAQAIRDSQGAIDSNVRSAAAKSLQDAGLLDIARKAGIALPQMTDAILGNKDAYKATSEALQSYYDRLLIASGYEEHGNDTLHNQADAAGAAIDKFKQLAGTLGQTNSEQAQLAAAAASSSTSTSDAGDAAQTAAGKLLYLGDATGMSKDQIDQANKTWQTWIKSLASSTDAFVDPLKTYQDMAQGIAQATADSTKSSKDSWQDYIKNVKIDLNDYATQLEQQLTDQENWRQNIVKIAQRGGVEVAQQFADMGMQGAGLTAQMANATDADFSRMAADMAQKAAMGGQNAATNLDEGMRIMAEVGAEGGNATAASVAIQLGIGADEVYNIAQQYGINLASGINPLLGALGKPGVYYSAGSRGGLGYRAQMAGGGVLPGYAPGVDSVPALLSPGEGVLVPEAVRGLGGADAIHAINARFSSRVPGFALGGFVTAADVPRPYSTAPYRMPISAAGDSTMGAEYAATTDWLQKNLAPAFTGGGGGAGSPFIRILGQAIAASMGYASQFSAIDYIFSHESGWNPNAQNPTSTAFGIPQFLNSTWGAYGGKTTDPAQQIRDGISYMRDRYGSPNAAAAFWQAHHWYRDGTNYVPSDQLAYLHRGEAVVPASANQGAPYQSRPMQLTGTLVLDSGEFLGVVSGVVGEYADAHHNRSVFNG